MVVDWNFVVETRDLFIICVNFIKLTFRDLASFNCGEAGASGRKGHLETRSRPISVSCGCRGQVGGSGERRRLPHKCGTGIGHTWRAERSSEMEYSWMKAGTLLQFIVCLTPKRTSRSSPLIYSYLCPHTTFIITCKLKDNAIRLSG